MEGFEGEGEGGTGEEQQVAGGGESQSVSDRIRSLRMRGETDWRRRVMKPVQERNACADKKSIILGRQLELRESLAEDWKGRVAAKDQAQFTATGKMIRDGIIRAGPRQGGGAPNQEHIAFKGGVSGKELPVLEGGVPKKDHVTFKGGVKQERADLDEGALQDHTPSSITTPNVKDHAPLDVEKVSKVEDHTPSECSGSFTDFNSLRLKDYLLKDRFSRPKREQRWRKGKSAHSTTEIELDACAVEGLKSTEDFSLVQLKGRKEEAKEQKMLFLFKGRRIVEPRLVQPNLTALSSADAFILLTNNKTAYMWTPLYANVLERSRCEEVWKSLYGYEKRRVEFEERNWENFLSELEPGPIDLNANLLNDEIYEKDLVTRIFILDGDQLQPLLTFQYAILQDTQVLVFDYLTEVYVWCGSHSDVDRKCKGMELAEGLCEGRGVLPKKIHQFMEPVWFIAKFNDWPITQHSTSQQVEGRALLIEPVDLSCKRFECDNDLILEGFNLGTDVNEITQVSQEDRRLRSVSTVSLEKWSVEKDGQVLMSSNLEEFSSCCVYILRWVYNVSYLTRDLKGKMSKIPSSKGRDRIAWFFWYGRGVQGTAQRARVGALFSGAGRGLFKDDEGVKMAVEEGSESELFVSLFSGGMKVLKSLKACSPAVFIVHKNKHVEISYSRSVLRSHSFFTFEIEGGNYYYKGENLPPFNYSKYIQGATLLSDQLRHKYFDEIYHEKITNVFQFGFENGLSFKCLDPDISCYDLDNILNRNGLQCVFIQGEKEAWLVSFDQEGGGRWNGYLKSVLKSVELYNSKRNINSIRILRNGLDLDLVNLFPFWECVYNCVEAVSFESDVAMVAEMERGGIKVTDLLDNGYYVDNYLDLNRIIELVDDQDLIDKIGVNATTFKNMPFWKQNLLRTKFIHTLFL